MAAEAASGRGAGPASAAAARAASLLVLWLVLSGADPADLPAGLVAVAAATWLSLQLLPPATRRLSALGVAGLVLRFPAQSVAAGVDVAWRALHPALPLRPGFVAVPLRLPPGPARDAFCMFTSLLPGTLPVGTDESGALVVHCLDAGQPVAERLAREESRFMRALGQGGGG